MSYVAYTPNVPFNSPVSMLIYEREASHHNGANASFHGSQNQEGAGEGGNFMGYHVGENKGEINSPA